MFFMDQFNLPVLEFYKMQRAMERSITRGSDNFAEPHGSQVSDLIALMRFPVVFVSVPVQTSERNCPVQSGGRIRTELAG